MLHRVSEERKKRCPQKMCAFPNLFLLFLCPLFSPGFCISSKASPWMRSKLMSVQCNWTKATVLLGPTWAFSTKAAVSRKTPSSATCTLLASEAPSAVLCRKGSSFCRRSSKRPRHPPKRKIFTKLFLSLPFEP